jgi:hypothetical protein
MPLEDSQLYLLDKADIKASMTSDVIDLIYPYNDEACGYLQILGHKVTGATDVKIVIQDSQDNSTFTARESVETTSLIDLNKGRVHVGLAGPLHRYVRVTVTVTGETLGGSISAFLTDKVERKNIYPATSNTSGPY